MSAVPVTLRRSAEADAPFLRTLFVASRPELAALEALGEQGRALVDLQLTAQRVQYLAEHPGAVDHVICVGGTRAGRCWVARSATDLRVLDLAVDPGHRRQGVARAVLAGLCAEAAAAGVPVRLSVWATNEPARRLYAAAGFRSLDAAGGRLELEYSPATAASA